MMRSNLVDTSEELNICLIGNGVKLIRPGKHLAHETLNLEVILSLPFPVYFEDVEHKPIKSNELTARACGYNSLNEFIGKPSFRYFKKDTVIQKKENLKKVIRNNEKIITEEYALLRDGTEINTFSVRMPWYDDNNKIIGLFGCSVLLGVNSLAESFNIMGKLGFLNFPSTIINPWKMQKGVHLSQREKQCLYLTIKGKPAKQVAFELNLSQRTVEEYLDNIKRKIGVKSKSALIEKGIEYFFHSYSKEV